MTEFRAPSEIDTLEQPTADSTAKKDADEAQRSSGILLICSFICIVLACLGIFYLFTKETPEVAQPAESAAPPVVPGGGGDGGTPTAPSPTVSITTDVKSDESTVATTATGAESTIKPTIHSTAKPTSNTTSKSTPTKKSTALPTSTTTTTTKPAYVYTPFLCTVTDLVSYGFRFPPDGMCEVVYFQSAYIYSSNMFSEPLTQQMRFFIDHANKHTNRTRYGIGISHMNNTQVLGEFKPSSPVYVRLNVFAAHKANNYAVLDLEAKGIFTRDDTFDRAMGVIVELVAYHKRQGHKPGINLIATMLPKDMLVDKLTFPALKKLHRMFNASFRTGRILKQHVQFLVYLTHFPFSEQEVATDCQIQTPQVLYRAPSTYRFHRERTSLLDAYHFNKNAKLIRDLDQYNRTISVTLRTVFKEPQHVDRNVPSVGNFGWNKECRAYGSDKDPNNNPPDVYDWWPWSNYSQICGDGVYSKNIDCTPKGIDEGCLTYDKQRERTIVWDDAVSLRRKICVSRRNLTFLYGFVVYAIDYDDWNYICPRLSPYGPYSRLRMMYLLRNYLRRDYHSQADEAGCLKVEPRVVSVDEFRKIQSWPEDGV